MIILHTRRSPQPKFFFSGKEQNPPKKCSDVAVILWRSQLMISLQNTMVACGDADQMTVNRVTKEATRLFQREGCRCRPGIHNCRWLWALFRREKSLRCSCHISCFLKCGPLSCTGDLANAGYFWCSRTRGIPVYSSALSKISKRAILAGNTSFH